MDFYADTSYKTLIKARLKELQARKPGLNLRRIATQTPIQYTYLSKALGPGGTHLSDDHLFTLAQILEFLPEETEYLHLVRAYESAANKTRKNHLYNRIEQRRKAKKLNVDLRELDQSRLNNEMSYLFEPLCLVVHASLQLPSMVKDPRLLCGLLGISIVKLREILRTLAVNEFIDLDEDGFSIAAVHQSKFHIGRGHPLMRLHQSLLKMQINSRLPQVSEEKKHSFLVTFTMDEESFGKVKEEFQTFLKAVENIAQKARDEHVYQLSFDLFEWL